MIGRPYVGYTLGVVKAFIAINAPHGLLGFASMWFDNGPRQSKHACKPQQPMIYSYHRLYYTVVSHSHMMSHHVEMAYLNACAKSYSILFK